MASQWKSQFDDSEETTDNEWKPESPEHRATLAPSEANAIVPPALSRISEDSRTSHRKYVNIAGIEEYPDLVGEFRENKRLLFVFPRANGRLTRQKNANR